MIQKPKSIYITHSDTKRLPKHALTTDKDEDVVTYLYNYYAEAHALVLPGRIPGINEPTSNYALPSMKYERDTMTSVQQAMEKVWHTPLSLGCGYHLAQPLL